MIDFTKEELSFIEQAFDDWHWEGYGFGLERDKKLIELSDEEFDNILESLEKKLGIELEKKKGMNEFFGESEND